MLHRAGVIDEMQHRSVVQRTEQWGGNVLLMLVRTHMMAEEELVKRLAERFGHVAEYPLPPLVDSQVLSTLPGEFCSANLVLPIRELPDGRLQVALANPGDLGLLDLLRTTSARDVTPVVSGPVAIHDAIRFQYFGEAVSEDDGSRGGLDTFGVDIALQTSSEAPRTATPTKVPDVVDIGDLFGGSGKTTPPVQDDKEPTHDTTVEWTPPATGAAQKTGADQPVTDAAPKEHRKQEFEEVALTLGDPMVVAVEPVAGEPPRRPGATVGVPTPTSDEDVADSGQALEAQLLQLQVLCRELSSELRDVLDLLVDKGVFTQDEYKAWRKEKRS